MWDDVGASVGRLPSDSEAITEGPSPLTRHPPALSSGILVSNKRCCQLVFVNIWLSSHLGKSTWDNKRSLLLLLCIGTYVADLLTYLYIHKITIEPVH